jgi:rhamnosyltransferase subunit B
VVANGSTGNVLSLLALSKALKDRGHTVSTIVAAHGLDAAGRLGLEAIVIPNSINVPGILPPRIPNLVTKSWIYQGLYNYIQRRERMLLTMRWLYRRLAERRQNYAAVVSQVPDFGARILRDKLQIPFVCIQLQPAVFRSAHEAFGLPLPGGDGVALRAARRVMWFGIDLIVDRILGSGINRFRSELELPPVRRILKSWIFSPDLNIGLFPPWYGTPQADWPPNTHLAGFPCYDDSDVSIPDDVDDFIRRGASPVVVTRSMHRERSESYFKSGIEVCRLLGRPGIFAGQVPESVVQGLPDFVRHVSWVPFSQLLARSAAIIHHGGIGTTALALAAGIPQLVVPLVDDQWDQARRVEQLGVGTWLHPRRFEGRTAAAKLRSLLERRETREACWRFAREAEKDDAWAKVCRLVEDLVLRASPIVAWVGGCALSACLYV